MPSREDFTYWTYLHVEDLLALQNPVAEPQHPDELQFIIIHQTYELWFKLVLHELERLIAMLGADDARGATGLARRLHVIMRLLAQQVSVLETMSPQDFHGFRGFLGTASGLQSYQFREVEVLCGLRDENYLTFIKKHYDGHIWDNIERRLAVPSLREEWLSLLARQGVSDPITLYKNTDQHYDLYQLAEALLEFDELMLRWRFLHLQLVERIIGGKVMGTGGTAADTYLGHTLKYRVFDDLWDVRNRLTEEAKASY